MALGRESASEAGIGGLVRAVHRELPRSPGPADPARPEAGSVAAGSVTMGPFGGRRRATLETAGQPPRA